MSGGDFLRRVDSGHRRISDVIDSINTFQCGTTAGTSTAYTASVLTPVIISRLLDGQTFRLIAHTSCGAAPTLSINSITAATIKGPDGTTALVAGDIPAGPFTVQYDSSNTSFRLLLTKGSLGGVFGANTTGSSNAYVLTTPMPGGTLVTGSIATFIASFTNTASPTLNWNGSGAKTIYKFGTNAGLEAGDIQANCVYQAIYDGTQYLLLNMSTIGAAYSKNFTPTAISNSAAETTIFSVTIPGNTLGVLRGIRYFATAHMLVNSVLVNGATIRFKYGSTTLLTDATTLALSVGGNPYTMIFNTLLASANATNAQSFGYTRAMDVLTATSNAGLATNSSTGYGYANEDSTGNLDFKVTVQLTAADANLSFTTEAQYIELL